MTERDIAAQDRLNTYNFAKGIETLMLAQLLELGIHRLNTYNFAKGIETTTINQEQRIDEFRLNTYNFAKGIETECVCRRRTEKLWIKYI